MKKELLIIIPAYNEEKTIGKLLDALQKPPVSEVADILVMNDASVDGTEREVKKKTGTCCDAYLQFRIRKRAAARL